MSTSACPNSSKAYVAPIGGLTTPDSIIGTSSAHCSLHVAGPHHRVGAPADAADVDVVEQQPVDLDLGDALARAKPTTSSRPCGGQAAQRVGEGVAADHVDDDVDAVAAGELGDGVLEAVEQHRLVGTGRRATSAFSSVLTTAIVRAPYPLATWIVAVPTPPAAPWTSTVSPVAHPPRSASANCAVR